MWRLRLRHGGNVRICRCVFAVDYIPMLLDSQPMTRVRNDELTQAFATVLRDLRQDLGISQEQLALRASVDRTFVGKLETGRHQPSLAVVFSLALALGTSAGSLVSRVQETLARQGQPPRPP